MLYILNRNSNSMINTMSNLLHSAKKNSKSRGGNKEIAGPKTKTAFTERAKSKSGKQSTKTPIIENLIFCDFVIFHFSIDSMEHTLDEFCIASKTLQPPSPPWPP